MQNKKHELLRALNMDHDPMRMAWVWHIQHKQMFTDGMMDHLSNAQFKQMLNHYLEKMRYDVFAFFAEQQRIVNDFDLEDSEFSQFYNMLRQ